MKIIKLMIFCLVLGIVYMGCKEDMGINEPLSKDSVKPGMVSNVKVTNKPGAAKIEYKIPSDNDLLYIKASYEIRPGVSREIKASYSNDSLVVDGFGEAKSYRVKIYAIDKSENESEPVEVTVNPLTPPYQLTLANLQVNNDFGGLRINFNNPTENSLAIVVLTKNDKGEEIPKETFYTRLKSGKFSLRGYDTTPRKFGFYIKDRFGNISDTLYKEITPIFETRLDRLKFKKIVLPTDRTDGYGWVMEGLWDDRFTEGQSFHTVEGQGIPLWFTFDMGVTAKLSRFKEFQRVGGWQWRHGNARKFEVWAIAGTPPSDGSFTGWSKLGTYESIKPSGLPPGENTAEDTAVATAGEEFEIDPNAPPVRYIRFRITQNWANTDFVHIMEVQFWGNPNP